MNLTKPLVLGLGALLVNKMLSRGNATDQSSVPQGSSAGAPSPDGGLVGGLGGLLEKLQTAGHGEAAKSWVGSGQNQPIEAGQLRSALGQKTLSDIARHAGISEQELLAQLSQNLPEFVDKLTQTDGCQVRRRSPPPYRGKTGETVCHDCGWQIVLRAVLRRGSD
jgi:uncharacterized protein YidB (DUF937 family)